MGSGAEHKHTTQSLGMSRQPLMWNKLGNAMLNLGQHRAAAALFRMGLAVAMREKDQRATAASRNNLGVAMVYLENDAEAEVLFTTAVASFLKLGERHAAALGDANLGSVADRNGRPGEASAHRLNAVATLAQIGDSQALKAVLDDIADDDGNTMLVVL